MIVRATGTATLRPPLRPDAALAPDLGAAPVPGAMVEPLDAALLRAERALLADQKPDGHWCYELEADCTIPAEYILTNHFSGELEPDTEARLARYIRARQGHDGGWTLYPGGSSDLSCSVKCYYALKLVGDAPDAEHMQRARELILAHGGAARSNVFTRLTLAFFRQVPWRAVPFVPVEIMLLPDCSPFTLSRVSYWSRCVMVPLAVLYSRRARARNPGRVSVRELFVTPPEQETRYFPLRSPLNRALLALERSVRQAARLIPRTVTRRAMRAAERWILERLNGEDGLGAIFPAMANAHLALAELGYASDHPLRQTSRRALHQLLVDRGEEWSCQPCVSPVWDTALAAIALQETRGGHGHPAAEQGLEWLRQRQVVDGPGDWRASRPDLRGGGWPFQYNNGHYPDLDDTAMVAWSMLRSDRLPQFEQAVGLAADWIAGMQSRNGGFAAFDCDNCALWLNEIPFADHGALLDPATADVSGGCLRFLARLGRDGDQAVRARCLQFLLDEQEPAGCWFGRWGSNYLYGTWAACLGLGEAGYDQRHPVLRRARRWLEHVQRPDGGWGESNDSYLDLQLAGRGAASTSFQTAWALLALMAIGAGESPAVGRGVRFLLERQQDDGLWHEDDFTAPGFPRVFYLRYHGYERYFPLWALARYRNLGLGSR